MNNNMISTQLVCFVVCDGGPAAHFLAFTNNLFNNNELNINIYATGAALNKLKDSYIPAGVQLIPFTIDDANREQQEQIATDLIDSCLIQGARTIIVDIGNKFDGVFEAVSSQRNLPDDKIRFWCYYDNPEPYVPGGYSIKAEETIKSSKHILFSNRNLAKTDSIIYSLPEQPIDLTNKIVEGIGYYSITDVEKLIQQRVVERDSLRENNDWTNVKHLLMYFGGNNDTYFDQAFPTFLSILSKLDEASVKDSLFILHQHPAAKKQNRDGQQLQEWLLKNNHIQFVISTLKTSDQAQIVADVALYYQTSMAPQFALLGLPTMQVGHEVYEDVLVKFNLCYTATNAIEFTNGLKSMKDSSDSSDIVEQRKQLIYNAIGYTSDWANNLRRIIVD